MDSSSADVTKDGSFYGVFVETEVDDSSMKKVFTELHETLSVVKCKKTARFKLFRSATEAERFSIFGQETPVKQIEKNNMSNNLCNNVQSPSYKSLKSDDLVVFRRLIEGGEIEKVKQAVYSNPRFLVSSGDTPLIIQEGCRYNAMHVAARYNQPEIVHFIMECVTSSDFIKSLYGTEQSYLSRSEIITDLYLNTPDKAANDTPLHIASKFGYVDVVKELVSYEKCILTCLNKYRQSAKDVICSRQNKEMYNNILNLIEGGYFVPMWKSNDDCVQPIIGKPFTPKSPTVFPILQSESPKQLNPILEIRAVAGPMKESQAVKFRNDWKSPVRKTLLSSTPQKCPTSPKQNEFNNKSVEKAGRHLAEKRKVGWAEYWPFLDKIVDLKSDKGLDLLEKYLNQRFNTNAKNIPEKCIQESTTILSPMSELCNALKTMRIGSIQKEKSPKRSTLVPYTCLVKSCKVLGERLLKVIISECIDMQNINLLANRLCHEVRHLLVLEDSFYSDNRFHSNIQGKIHERVSEHLCQLLINNLELSIDISSVITKLQKYFACHAIGSRSEITAACLVSLMYKIWHEKLFNVNYMELNDEECCKQWFLTVNPCSCNIEAKPPLKPIQLFLDDTHLKTSLENRESKNNTLIDNIKAYERREPSLNGYDSDDDIFSSAPSSPCNGYSSSDESNMFFNAERDFAYLLFSRNKPVDEDYEIFDAINDINVDSNKYPWVYRWMYSLNDYNNKLLKLENSCGIGETLIAWQKGSGTYLAITSFDQFIGIYNRNGKLIEKIKILGICTGLAWDRDGDLLGIICDGSSTLMLWEANSSKIEQINPVFKDNLTCILWSKVSQTVAVTSVKGNLTIYDYVTTKRIPVLGKHSRSITCGEWNRDNILALGSQDQTVSINNIEGDTLKIISLRGEPSKIAFSKMKSDHRKHSEETVSVLVSNKTLYLIDLQDTDNPFELAFNLKYGSIVTYHWYGDGYILIGFSEGYLISISTHPKEVGKELFQVRNHKEMLSDVGLSKIAGKVATCGEYTIKVHEIGKLQETTAVLNIDEGSVIDHVTWSEDGRLLAATSSDGCVHLYLEALSMLSSTYNNYVAFLTSLNQVTIHYCHSDKNQSPNLVTINTEMEPSFLGIGPYNLVVGMNNRIWYYKIDTSDSSNLSTSLLGDREYLGSIKNVCLNGEFISVLFEGRLQIHTIDSIISKTVNDSISKIFPTDKGRNINNQYLTNDFLIYSTELGNIHYFHLEDWNEAFTHKHHCGIVNLYPNQEGIRCVIVDAKNEAYLYIPVSEETLPIKDFPTSACSVFWDLSEKCVFIACNNKSALTFVYIRNSINGSEINFIGSTKLPERQIPLFLSHGDLFLETSTGKLNSLTLSTHTALLIRPAATTLSHPTERLEQDLDKQLALIRINDAWKTCQLLNKKEYWEKLGMSCLNYFDIETALQVYTNLGDVSMVWSLELIKGIEDKNLFAGHLAMYMKKFNKAQKLFLESSNPIQALEMRQNLLQWDVALDLAKTLAPERMPYISYKYGQQLELIGKAHEALLQYEQGLDSNTDTDHLRYCNEGIARCLIKCGNAKKGIDIALDIGSKKLLKECAELLENTKKLSDAADLYVKIENWDQAASCYIRLKNWSKVGEYATYITSTKIHAQYAKAMEAMGNYKKALCGYNAAHDYENVIRLDLDRLEDPQDAIRVVQEHRSTEGSKMIARYFQKNNEILLAIRFLAMSHCFTDAFRLACDHDQLELYGDVLLDEDEEVSIPEFASLAKYYETQNSPALAGKYYFHAKNYQKALNNLIEGSKSNPKNDEILSLTIEVVAAAKNSSIDEEFIKLLLGEVDGYARNPKFLFRLHMARNRYREAAKVAIILANNEQVKGNYRQAHDVLYNTICELRNNHLKVSNEMTANLALLHSYILVRIYVRLDNHSKAAPLLIRVSENIDRFPSHAVQILTSTVIECYRSNMKESAFKFATILMKSDYRHQIDEKYRKKIESVIRKSPRIGSQSDIISRTEPCPYCEFDLPITSLTCTSCKSTIPFCIASGWHITKENLTFCPNCQFPALYNEFAGLLESGENCPMCSNPVKVDYLQIVEDPKPFLFTEEQN